MQLSEFEVIAITPTTIRGQAIANLLANFPGENSWDITDDVPGELPAIALVETAGAAWTLHFDGSSTTSKGGAGIVLSKSSEKQWVCHSSLIFHALTIWLNMKHISRA